MGDEDNFGGAGPDDLIWQKLGGNAGIFSGSGHRDSLFYQLSFSDYNIRQSTISQCESSTKGEVMQIEILLSNYRTLTNASVLENNGPIQKLLFVLT